MIVEKFRQIQSIIRFGPIAKHNRHGGQYLNVDSLRIALFDASLPIPTILIDIAKEFSVVTHHASFTRGMMVQLNEAAVTIFPFPIRNVLRQNVSVTIDLRHPYSPSGLQA